MIKAIVFDLNGVFLQSDYLTKRIEDKFGISSEESLIVLKESLKETRLNPTVKIFKYWIDLFKNHNIEITEDEFLSFWFSGESLVNEFVLLSKKLRERGFAVYIFSNNFKERTEYYRKNFKEIFDNVDSAFFSWETGFVKSDLKAYSNLISNINVKPEEIIYFDDSEENVQLAISLGIKAYVYKDFNNTKRVLAENMVEV
jgi:putative hydrolase of the HAD superfamily